LRDYRRASPGVSTTTAARRGYPCVFEPTFIPTIAQALRHAISISMSVRSKSWYGPDDRYLKVRADDGSLYILHFNEPHDEWALIMYRRAK
jgi:hypothetical protein